MSSASLPRPASVQPLRRAAVASFAALAAIAALPTAARAVNCIPPADANGNWLSVSWGASGGVAFGLPGNNAGANDAVYIRRNNIITIDTDVSPPSLGYTGGISRLDVGDGFDGPQRGAGTLILTGTGRLRVANAAGTPVTVSIVNTGRDRPNSVGVIRVEDETELIGGTLNVGATTVAYLADYLTTHTVPSSGTLTLAGQARASFTSLSLGTTASNNNRNTSAGFPPTTGLIEILGAGPTLTISGTSNLNSSGTLRLVASTDAIPKITFGGTTNTEAGFRLVVDLSAYNTAPILAGSTPVSIPLLTFTAAGGATTFAAAADVQISGHDASLLSATVAASGTSFQLILAPVVELQPTGSGIQVSHQPSPSAIDILLGRDIYIADPAIAVMPDGAYLIAHSIFGNGTSNSSLYTKVFRSTDRGANWTHVATLPRLQRANFFTHNGVVYCLGTGFISGSDSSHLVIMKSTDSGITWTAVPNATTDPGYLRTGGTGTPSTPVIYNNRVWMARATLGLSGDLTKDLMTMAAWTVHSNPQSTPHADTRPAYRDAWPAYNDQTFELWSESQIVAAPHTGVVLMPKIEMKPVAKGTTSVPHFSHIPHIALHLIPSASSSVSINPATMFVPLPGTQKKFGASYDPVTQRFYALTNTVLPAFETAEDAKHIGWYKPQLTRNTGTLYSSRDLVHWDLEKIFIHSDSIATQAWQYFNFVFDQGDMLVASRTAFRTAQDSYNPPRGHDSNLLTFHRIPGYGTPTVIHTLTISGGQVLRAEVTDYQPAPLGLFVLGAQPSQPNALGTTPSGTIVIRQQNGALLEYDSQGNFLATLNSLPDGTSLSAGPLSLTRVRTTQRSWAQPAGGSWYDPRNWHYFSTPDTAYEIATLGSAATSAATLSIDRPTTLNGLVFRSPTPYTLAADSIVATNGTLYHSGSLTLAANPDTAAAPSLQVLQGAHVIGTPLTLPVGSSFVVAAGASLHLSSSLTLTGSVTVDLDLAGLDPSKPPLVINSLGRSTSAATLTLRLANIPAGISAPSAIARIESFSGLTPGDIQVVSLAGTPLPFSFEGGTLSLSPSEPPLTLINEYPTPDDNSRLTWFGSNPSYIDREASPGLKILGVDTEGGSNSGLHHAVAYFTDPGKPLALEPGHSITLSARITPTRTTSLAASNALRFGLFNSRNRPAERIVTDSSGASNTSTGYMIGLNTSASGSGSLVAYSRSPDPAAAAGNTYALIIHSSAFQNRGNSPFPSGKLTQGQSYTIRLTLTRTGANAIDVEGSILGGDLPGPVSVSFSDTPTTNRDGAICTAFDTIAFAAANNAGISDLLLTDIALSVPHTAGAPVVLLHPADQSLPHLASFSLSVIANGAEPLSYQWNHNGTPIPGANAPTFSVSEAASLTHAGTYTCTVSNGSGTVVSAPANVVIAPAPRPTQVFVHEFPIGSSAHNLTWYGSTADVLTYTGSAIGIRGNLGNGLASPTGLRHILTHFADTSSPIVLETGQTITVSLRLTPVVTTTLSASNALRIALLNSFGRTENIITTHSNPGGVTAAGYAGIIHSHTGGFALTARRATPPPGDDEDAFYASSLYLVFSYPYQTLATRSGLVPGNALLSGQTYQLTQSISRVSDTSLSITLTLSGGHLSEPVSFTTTDSAASNNRDSAIVTGFDTLAIAVSGNAGLDSVDISDLRIIIPEQSGAPYIHKQPADQRVLAGQPALLHVNASGELPLSFQWYRDGEPIPNATGQTYAVAAVSAEDDSNNYICVITNPAGSTATRPAQIAIRTPETIVAPTPASYLASRMVLQRDKPNTIWGVANPHDPITVTLVDTTSGTTVATASTKADASGHFLTSLPALPWSASPHELRISNGLDTTTLTDILIGEVWLCGGQSNMAWSVGSSNNAGAEIAAAANFPLIRVYKAILAGSATPQENNPGTWHLGTPGTIRITTAVGTFFTRTLAQTALQGIPIGLLDVSRGGSSAESWVEREALRRLGYTAYANSTGDDTHAGAALYNAMIHPIRHASLAGIVWYQGEHNSTSYDKAAEYRLLFPQLIDNWRNDVFRDPDLPFYFVLLANFIRTVDSTSEGWAWGRYAQLFGLTRSNTAFAAAHDIGDFFDTHPRNKQDVGLRLALNALKNHYGYPHLEDTGPRASTATIAPGGSTVTVSFRNVQGLFLDTSRRVAFEPDPDRNIPNGYVCPDFQLAGADGVWHAAEAAVASTDGVTAMLLVSSAAVPAPKRIRYAWNNAPSSILFNTVTHPVTGDPYPLPATPFLLDVVEAAVPPVDPSSLAPDALLSYAFRGTTEPAGLSAQHLPHLQMSTSGSAALTFDRLHAGLVYVVELSSDLHTWSVINANPGAAGGPVTVTLPPFTTPDCFIRVRVVVP